MSELNIMMIPSEFKCRYFFLPNIKKMDNSLSLRDYVNVDIDDFLSPHNVELLPFKLETGADIRAGYDSITETVIITEHKHLCCSLSIGLAANYIAFILSMPKACWRG